MKKQFLFASFAIFGLATAQNTGINTTNPTHTLDVNGKLRVREMENSGFLNYILGVDSNGEIKKTNYANYIVDAGNLVATSPVDVVVDKDEEINDSNITLGVSKTITVPKGQRYVVAIYYNVAVGQLQESTTPVDDYLLTIPNGNSAPIVLQKTYHGIVGSILTKGDVPTYAAKKISMRPAFGGYVQPETITNFYTETLDNTRGNTAMTVTYALKGIVFHVDDYLSDGVGGTIRFNGSNNIYHPEANIEYTGMSYVVLNMPLQ